VGRGTKISFWYDNWIEAQNFVDLLGLDDDALPDPNIKVSEFIHNAQWDMQKLNQTLQCHHLIQKIIRMALPFAGV